jgi:hypothetical protein
MEEEERGEKGEERREVRMFNSERLFLSAPKKARKDSKDDLERSFLLVSPEYEAFSKQWFEVGMEYPSGVDPLVSPLTVDFSPSPSPYTGYSPYAKSPYDYTARLYNSRNCELGRGRGGPYSQAL